MREIVFLKQNEAKWRRLEDMLKSKKTHDPDELSQLFIQLTDDLAYAQTFYPDSKTTLYLNQLSGQVRLELYKNKREDRSRFALFWTQEVPLILFEHRKVLATAFIIFIAAVTIGWFSAAYDKDFVRLILSDGYVDQTIANIESGKPMNIYGDSGEGGMFSYIAFNNIRVSFLAFVGGMLWGLGTVYLLLFNGIMVGAFMRMFYDFNVFTDALLSVWMHGTIEISIIIVAAAAGLILGKSIVFPGTFSRVTAMTQGARDGIKIIIGLIPCFILAAFIEGYLTRHYNIVLLSTSVILISLAFVITYFVVYPYYIGRTKQHSKSENHELLHTQHYFVYAILWGIIGILATVAGLRNAYGLDYYMLVMSIFLASGFFILKSKNLLPKL